MAENRKVRKYEEEKDLFLEQSLPENMMSELMGHFFETGRHHLDAALVLTKLVADKAEKLTKEDIFSAFKESLAMLDKIAPVEKMLEKIKN